MTLTSLISSIIALAFLYTVFSVFASELQEYIAAIFESRAKRLKQSIRQMLGEQDWPFYPLEIEGEKTINNDSKIWIEDGKIRVVNNDDNVFTEGQDKQLIWIKDSDKTTEVEDNNVNEDPPNSGQGKTQDTQESVTKYPVYTVSQIQGKEGEKGQDDRKYWLDIDNERITDRISNPSKEIKNINSTDFPVYSLTEKLYQHPNIRALNQSSFGWILSLLQLWQNKKGTVFLIAGVVFLIASFVSLIIWSNSVAFLMCFGIFAIAVLCLTIFYRKNFSTQSNSKVRNDDKSQNDDQLTKDLEEIAQLTSVINAFNFGYFPSDGDSNNRQCNIQELTKSDEETENIDDNQDTEEAPPTSEIVEQTPDREPIKNCFIAVENQLITMANKENNSNVTTLLLLKSSNNTQSSTENNTQFLKSIETVRNNDGSIKDNQLNEFWTEYKSFINAKYKKRLDLILNLKNEPQLQLAQQINKTVENQGGWWKVPVGWVITAIAISMGAPFWFDILSRIVNVRNANKDDE